jgi:hypothetical protein
MIIICITEMFSLYIIKKTTDLEVNKKVTLETDSMILLWTFKNNNEVKKVHFYVLFVFINIFLN